jgi:hypothetical protein
MEGRVRVRVTMTQSSVYSTLLYLTGWNEAALLDLKIIFLEERSAVCIM